MKVGTYVCTYVKHCRPKYMVLTCFVITPGYYLQRYLQLVNHCGIKFEQMIRLTLEFTFEHA